MINLEFAIIWGTKLERIRSLLNQTEELHVGLYIHSLRYDSPQKEKEEKKKYLEGLKKQIDRLKYYLNYLNNNGFDINFSETFNYLKKLNSL